MDDYNILFAIDKSHNVYLVQSSFSNKIYVEKILDVYNIYVYEYLYRNHIAGIPRIVNYFERDNRLYIIEEYISGISLQEKIDNCELSVSDIRSYMIMLCNVVESLHSITPLIIHRDIKPSNIIITSYNYAILLDFNAAKQFSNNEKTDTILLGTPGYAAPEQYGFGPSSPQTDIYSLGIVLKEMVDSLNNPTHDFDNVIENCTQLTPSLRYHTVTALKQDLSLVTNAFIDFNAETEQNKKSSHFLPPGYRTKTPWKMMLSSIVYIIIFGLCCTVDIENVYGAKLWLERVFMLIMFLTIIFCGFNYMDMQKFLPLCKNKYRFLHYIGIVLLDTIIIFSLFVILIIIESLFFPS